MPSIDTMINALEKTADCLKLDTTKCTHSRNCHSACSSCIEACSTSALALLDDCIMIDKSACTACGRCATACPTGALEVIAPSDKQIIDACVASVAKTDSEIIIAENSLLEAANGLYEPSKVVGVNSLDRLSVGMLLHLALLPSVNKITLVADEHSPFPKKNDSVSVRQTVNLAQALLSVWNNPFPIRVTEKLPGKIRANKDEAYDKSKRDFFSAVKAETTRATIIATEQSLAEAGLNNATPQVAPAFKVDANGILPQSFPENRKWLLEALSALGEPKPLMINSSLWGSVSIDVDLCTSCRMCATFCPTGALFKFRTKTGEVGLKHRARNCVACGCCRDMCPAHALSLSTRVKSTDIAQGTTSRYVLHPEEITSGGTDSMMQAMRKLMSGTIIHER